MRTLETTFCVRVDYGRSVENGVTAGRFRFVSPDISSYHFSTEVEGRASVTIELVQFDESISTEEALERLDARNLRAADLHELLALAEAFPDVSDGSRHVVALGSSWRLGILYFPCLCRTEQGRSLMLTYAQWSAVTRFAAVRLPAQAGKED